MEWYQIDRRSAAALPAILPTTEKARRGGATTGNRNVIGGTPPEMPTEVSIDDALAVLLDALKSHHTDKWAENRAEYGYEISVAKAVGNHLMEVEQLEFRAAHDGARNTASILRCRVGALPPRNLASQRKEFARTRGARRRRILTDGTRETLARGARARAAHSISGARPSTARYFRW
jgi:hypothetical protein